MARPIITLTTDFGDGDSYVAQMKGVMLAINPEIEFVDVTHRVPAQDIERAATVLDETIDMFPPNTIHVVIVDPGVGTSRRMVAAEFGQQRVVAPDNGVLSLVAERLERQRAVELTSRKYWRDTVSDTFHGRDVIGPVAAHWSTGVDILEFGEPLDGRLAELSRSQPELVQDELAGEIVWVDAFGNLITNIEDVHLPEKLRKRLVVVFGAQTIHGIHRRYADRQPGTLMAIIGSSRRLEIAVSQGSAAEVLQLSAGTPVRVTGLKRPSDG